jgi:hypothetical protein
LSDPKAIEDMVQLSLLLAPLRTLDEKLRDAADEETTPLNVVNDILRTARLAEMVTFGRQVEKRLQILSIPHISNWLIGYGDQTPIAYPKRGRVPAASRSTGPGGREGRRTCGPSGRRGGQSNRAWRAAVAG